MELKNFTIKNLIDYRRKSIRSRETFIKGFQKFKVSAESGGDYWISAVSAISRAFKTTNKQEITDKINVLLSDVENAIYSRTKLMYQRNLHILHTLEDFDFNSLKPSFEVKFLKKPKILQIVEILDLPLKIAPTHVFTYEENGTTFIGGLWIACKLEGYTNSELATFTEALYKYLEKNYSNEYVIDKRYCSSLDAFTGNVVNYEEIEDGSTVSIFDSTIPMIKDAI